MRVVFVFVCVCECVCVCVCVRARAPRYNVISTCFRCFGKKKKRKEKKERKIKQTNKQKIQQPTRWLKETFNGALNTFRDAIRCCARTDECLTNSSHANEERVQLETKYNISNQIAYYCYPNKTLLLCWPFTQSRPFLCTVTYIVPFSSATRIPKLSPTGDATGAG